MGKETCAGRGGRGPLLSEAEGICRRKRKVASYERVDPLTDGQKRKKGKKKEY